MRVVYRLPYNRSKYEGLHELESLIVVKELFQTLKHEEINFNTDVSDLREVIRSPPKCPLLVNGQP
jgi:hypothetical protein